jgi:hypothetical protein
MRVGRSGSEYGDKKEGNVDGKAEKGKKVEEKEDIEA